MSGLPSARKTRPSRLRFQSIFQMTFWAFLLTRQVRAFALASSHFHRQLAGVALHPIRNTRTRNCVPRRTLLQLTAVTKKKSTYQPKLPTNGRPYRFVIVESPSKCKTIESILNQYVQEKGLGYDFVVASCYGHVRNLPKNHQQLGLPRRTTKTSGAAQIATSFPYSIVGVDLEHDYRPSYVLLEGKEKLVRELRSISDGAQRVYLATDPDREGEAIAWHLEQVLELDPTATQRLSFSEITPQAIRTAVQNPTGLNHNLVQAQETRRILDRLAGFTVSPVLWKKIAPGLSAGRVQSVGMALCVQRERERLRFRAADYWDVWGNFSAAVSSSSDFCSATLSSVNGTSLVAGKADFVDSDDLHGQPQPKPNKRLLTQLDAEALVTRLEHPFTRWRVVSVRAKERFTYPAEPFKTSTLQQEANQRLGMSVSETMRTAQMLYEAGWISYMRTDATHLSEDAHKATLQGVTRGHGPHYVDATKVNNTASAKKKNRKKDQSDKVAQEAHEAIRPAIQPNGQFAEPAILASTSGVAEIAQKLYELIYRRTLASRMTPQRTNQTTVVVEGTTVEGDVADFRASGSVVLEPGYTLEWYRASADGNRALPPLQEGQDLSCHDLEPQLHTTQPPARYTEASLVKELEALGVGRPSTYAGIVHILRERAYVGSPTSATATPNTRARKEASGAAITAQRAAGGGDLFGAQGPLVPSLSAFVVTSLLEQHCPTYVDPSFTARMEENLDRIAHGSYEDNTEMNVAQQRVAYLNEFYAGEHGLAAQIKRIDEGVQAEQARRVNLPALESWDEDIGIYIGPWGPYIQHKNENEEPLKANLPSGMATDLSSITPATLKALLQNKQEGTILGQHPYDGRNIFLRVGRFGAYLQWGEAGSKGTTTHSLPKNMGAMRNLQTQPGPRYDDGDLEDVEDDMPTDSSVDAMTLEGMLGITLEEAVGYCGLPRTVATLDEKPIVAAIGPYGPYLKYNNSFVSLQEKQGHVLTVDEETAKQLVIDSIVHGKKSPGRGVLAELGEMDGNMVTVKSGRYGAYINWKKVNAKLPPEYADNPDALSLDQAWTLIVERAAESPKAKKGSSNKNSLDLPQAPKRPKTAYMYFSAAKRSEIAEAGKSMVAVSKELASMWAETSDTEKQPYNDLAETGKVKYQRDKAVWEEECQKLQGGRSPLSLVRHADPLAPKRARSAYIYFCNAMRPEVSQRVDKLGDISKELARMWAETTDRSEYAAMAKADQARYATEKAERQGGSDPSTITNGVAVSKAQQQKRQGGNSPPSLVRNADPLAPKRARSAYIYFCNAMRPEVSQRVAKLGDISKELARMWAETTDRSEYIALAEADQARYATEKVEYQEGSSPSTITNGLPVSNIKMDRTLVVDNTRTNSKPKQESSPTKTTKRAPSAYMIFCRETRHEIVDENGQKLPLGETTKHLAQRWKDCDHETRARFVAMAEEEKERLLTSL